MYVAVAGFGQDAAQSDVASSCPWPWQDPVCPPECYCDFYGALYSTSEVYVYRLIVALPSPIQTTSQALLFARALGEGFLGMEPYDVRGVAFKELGGGRYQLDIVYTATSSSPPIAQKNDAGLLEAIANSPYLRDEYPGMVAEDGQRLQLLDKGAIAYWLSTPVVWSDALDGPTQAYGRGDNVWTGTAAQRQSQLEPKQPVPVGPQGGGNSSSQSAALVGVAVIGAILWMAFSKRGRQ